MRYGFSLILIVSKWSKFQKIKLELLDSHDENIVTYPTIRFRDYTRNI